MIKNLNLQKDEEVVCSIGCYPSFKSILKDSTKNILGRFIFSLMPGVVTPTRYEGKIDLILTNKNLYLEYSQDDYNSTLEFNIASKCIPLNKVKNFSVNMDEHNEKIDISFNNDCISLLHPNTANKQLACKIADYITSLK